MSRKLYQGKDYDYLTPSSNSFFPLSRAGASKDEGNASIIFDFIEKIIVFSTSVIFLGIYLKTDFNSNNKASGSKALDILTIIRQEKERSKYLPVSEKIPYFAISKS